MRGSWILQCLLLYLGLVNFTECADTFRYTIEEKNDAVVGRVSSAVKAGDRVLAVLEQLTSDGHGGHGEEGEGEPGPIFLEIRIWETSGTTGRLTSQTTTSSPTKAVSKGVTNAPVASLVHPNDPKAEPSHLRSLSVEGLPDVITSLGDDVLSPLHPLHNVHLTHMSANHLHPHANKREVHSDASGSEVKFNPAEVRFKVHGTDIFIVDYLNRNYIVVDKAEALKEHDTIEFYVYLVDSADNIISNPLPFFVYVDHEVYNSGYPTAPAVFAGVLVLCVIFLAILIPLVTRAKRRKKQGKPLFKLGSHPSTIDLEKATLPRNQSEPNWYGNNTFIDPEEEVAHEQLEFSREIRRALSTTTHAPSNKEAKREPLSEQSSSGIDVESQDVDVTDGASGNDDDDRLSQRL